MGEDSSMRRQTRPTILSMIRRRWFSSTKRRAARGAAAPALDVDRSGPLTIIR